MTVLEEEIIVLIIPDREEDILRHEDQGILITEIKIEIPQDTEITEIIEEGKYRNLSFLRNFPERTNSRMNKKNLN